MSDPILIPDKEFVDELHKAALDTMTDPWAKRLLVDAADRITSWLKTEKPTQYDDCECGLPLSWHTQDNLSTPAPHECVGFKAAHLTFGRTERFVRGIVGTLETAFGEVRRLRGEADRARGDAKESDTLRRDVTRLSRHYHDVLDERNDLQKKYDDLHERLDILRDLTEVLANARTESELREGCAKAMGAIQFLNRKGVKHGD